MTEPKPIQRTNVFAGEFSPSGIETARCLRRFYYQKILGLKPASTPTALVFGISIHSAVELFYELHGSEIGHDEIKRQVIQEFVREWNTHGLMGDVKRNLDTGILIMNSYCDRYRDDMAHFKREDIESDQWLPMPNGTMMLVKMDRIYNRDDQIILVDTKTTSMPITDYYFRNFDNHMPTTLYAYSISELLGHCDSIIIDAIKVPPPPPTSKTAPFGRATFIRSELQLHDAVNTFCAITDYIMATLKKPKAEWIDRFYCNQAECDKYGGCPYIGICKYGLDHPSTTVDFEHKPVVIPPEFDN